MKLFLPRPGRKVQTFVNRAALSGRKISPNSKVQSPSSPPLPFFFNFFSSSSGDRNEEERWRATRTRTVKGRENCARWPFRNTMEINLSSLTNLRGHKATEDRGIALIITRSARDSRGFPREKKKKRKIKTELKKFPPLARLSVRDDRSSALYFRR